MIIVKYQNNKNIDVYFEEYNWTFKNVNYRHFKNGNIKCPYEPRVYGKGYIGEGLYKTTENGKNSKCYTAWKSMLRRCYDLNFQQQNNTYEKCEVESYFLNFQNFAEWYKNNFYQIPNEKMNLDKDILVKGNKIYSRDTCIFVPQRINSLFIKCDKSRGKNPIGINQTKFGNYRVQCNNGNGLCRLGTYSTHEEAFKVYKNFKEKVIKQVADEYKDKIPNKLYQAMYNYKVEITD